MADLTSLAKNPLTIKVLCILVACRAVYSHQTCTKEYFLTWRVASVPSPR